MTTSRPPVPVIITAVLVFALAAVWVDVPGYLDAEYYRSVALRLTSGHGLTVPFIWNYLARPEGLPSEAHTYWMPLASLAGALTTWIAPGSFRATQLVFIVIAILVPGMTWYAAHSLGMGQRRATYAALLACFPGFYLPFWVTSDTFALFAVVGGAAILMAHRSTSDQRTRLALLSGVLAGLGHLTRADGFLLWIALAWILYQPASGRRTRLLAAAAGYLIVLLPWLVRNYLIVGSVFPPGGVRSLWLTSYDQLFAYPAESIGPQALLAGSLSTIAVDRLRALGTNLQSLVFVNGLLFLIPFILYGLWKQRDSLLAQGITLYMLGLLMVMSLVFPYAGSRGGFFHSSTILMPFFYPLAVKGIEDAAGWYARRRGRDRAFAMRAFLTGAIIVAGAATATIYYQRVIDQGWGSQMKRYMVSDQLWTELPGTGRVAVNNPAGYWLATGRSAIVIPDGRPGVLLAAMQRYQAGWVILEADHPAGLSDLYTRPADRPGLRLVSSIELADRSVLHLYQSELEGR